MPRPSRHVQRGGEIILPHKFSPRAYQRNVGRALEHGIKRLLIIWHRKGGKDILALVLMINMMVGRPGLYLYTFPDGVQARRVIWDGMTVDGRAFLDLFPKEIILERNETEMSIRTVSANGGTSIFQLVGTDKPERLRGPNPVGIVFSEYSYQDPLAWETLAPVLAANQGWALFNYTPNGRGHGFELYRQAVADPTTWFAEMLTIEQTRKDAPGEDGSAVITAEALAAERARGVDEDFIQQEYFCSFEGTRSGSYYGDALRRAREQGRVGRVPWDPTVPVECWADLGLGEHLAVWFTQSVGPRIHVIRFWQGQGSDSIVELAKTLKELPYTYATHIWPHDAEGKEQGTGKTRREMAEALGIHPIDVQPKAAVSDGITAARALLERCYFDETACRQGLNALGFYHRDWDPKRQTWKDDPPHDWSSHAADAFRTGAMGTRGGVPLVARPPKVVTEFSLNLGPGASFRNTPKGFSW